MTVRTRFAPSPTGMLHIGGFRTALYAWAFARKEKGQFILRVEDTDQERKVQGAIAYILNSFKWFDIDIDEGPSAKELQAVGESGAACNGGASGPYIQSLRKERYQEVAEQLLAKGFAYRSTLAGDELSEAIASGAAYEEEIADGAQAALRLKLPKDFSIRMQDAVRGSIQWEQPPLKDPVLLKSDGLPTYHLACVVDDHDMNITHVFRGEEWIPTTPIHLYLYDILGWERPTFCHLATILGDDGKKLSKRHGAASVDVFKDEGYLPEALLNFIALIGWSPGDDREVFSRDEFIQAFSLEGLGTSGGVFDKQKLDWMNGEYLRKVPSDTFVAKIQEVVGGIDITEEALRILEQPLKERIKFYREAEPLLGFLGKIETFDTAFLEKKKIDSELAGRVVSAVKEKLELEEDFSPSALESVIKPLASELDVKVGVLFMCTRIAATGSMTALPLFDCMAALGKERVLSRLEQFLQAF